MSIKDSISRFVFFIVDNFASAPNKNNIALGGSILASGTALTLIFNNSDTLFRVPDPGVPNLPVCRALSSFGAFCWDIGLNYESTRILLVLLCIPAIIGFLPSVNQILHLIPAFAVAHNTQGVEGGDQLKVTLCILLALISIQDFRLHVWKQTQNIINEPKARHVPANVILWCIVLQVSYVYFEAGIAKAVNPIWSEGTALWYWVQNSGFGVNDTLSRLFMDLLAIPIFSAAGTWGVIVFEILLSLGIIFSRTLETRRILLFSGITFHALITLVMGLTTFMITMVGALVIVLLRDDKINLDR